MQASTATPRERARPATKRRARPALTQRSAKGFTESLTMKTRSIHKGRASSDARHTISSSQSWSFHRRTGETSTKCSNRERPPIPQHHNTQSHKSHTFDSGSMSRINLEYAKHSRSYRHSFRVSISYNSSKSCAIPCTKEIHAKRSTIQSIAHILPRLSKKTSSSAQPSRSPVHRCRASGASPRPFGPGAR